jgi:hypothetical protein
MMVMIVTTTTMVMSAAAVSAGMRVVRAPVTCVVILTIAVVCGTTGARTPHAHEQSNNHGGQKQPFHFSSTARNLKGTLSVCHGEYKHNWVKNSQEL